MKEIRKEIIFLQEFLHFGKQDYYFVHKNNEKNDIYLKFSERYMIKGNERGRKGKDASVHKTGFLEELTHLPLSNHHSFEELLEFLDIFSEFCGGELPVEAEVIEHTLLRLPAFGHFGGVPGGVVGAARGRKDGVGDFDLLALEAVEDGGVVAGVEVGALGVHPPLALVAHDPLLAVVAEVEVDLLAVEAVALLLVLPHAHRAQVFRVVLVGQVVLARLVRLADLVAAHVRVRLLLLLRLRRARRGVPLQQLAHALVLHLRLLRDPRGVYQTHYSKQYERMDGRRNDGQLREDGGVQME